jgi:hypothetical protein
MISKEHLNASFVVNDLEIVAVHDTLSKTVALLIGLMAVALFRPSRVHLHSES